MQISTRLPNGPFNTLAEEIFARETLTDVCMRRSVGGGQCYIWINIFPAWVYKEYRNTMIYDGYAIAFSLFMLVKSFIGFLLYM